MEWRRRKHKDVWHFMETCRWWPADKLTRVGPIAPPNTVLSLKKPRYGEFCNECMSKQRRASLVG